MPDELGGMSGVELPVGGATPMQGAASSRRDALPDVETEERSDSTGDIETLQAENAALQERVAELESALAAMESLHKLERELLDAGVVDLETALALAEPRVRAGEEASAVASSLVSGKPFLFASPVLHGAGAGGGSSQSARSGASAGGLGSLADEARRTGDRRVLTRYLRQRRLG
ncbi:MAG: hypothetical protein ACTS22_09955 [Phycisphaerales bacterium]